MNLHLKTGLGNKNYVLDPNSDVENGFFWPIFLWQFWAKNTKINFSSESVKTKEHKESNSCDKYHFSINAFYKINLWPILKKLLQKIDFHHFPLFEIIALIFCIVAQDLKEHQQFFPHIHEKNTFQPNQTAPFIPILREVCCFSLDQWETKIYLIWRNVSILLIGQEGCRLMQDSSCQEGW